MRIGLSILFALCIQISALGQITIDATGVDNVTACTTPCTFTPVTVTTQPNQILLVFFHFDGSSDAVTAATWNGDSMTQIQAGCVGSNSTSSAWYILTPDAGMNTISTTHAGTDDIGVWAASVYNVDGAPSASGCALNFHPNPCVSTDLAITTVVDGWFIDFAGTRRTAGASPGPLTPDAGTSYNENLYDGVQKMTEGRHILATGTTTTSGWTCTPTDVRWAVIALALDPVSSGGAVSSFIQLSQ